MGLRQNIEGMRDAYRNELSEAQKAHAVLHQGAIEQEQQISTLKYQLLGNEAVSASGVVRRSEMEHARGIAVEQVTSENQAIPVSFSENPDRLN